MTTQLLNKTLNKSLNKSLNNLRKNRWNFPVNKQVFQKHVMPYLEDQTVILYLFPSLCLTKSHIVVRNNKIMIYARKVHNLRSEGKICFKYGYKKVSSLSPYLSEITLKIKGDTTPADLVTLCNMLAPLCLLRSLYISKEDYIYIGRIAMLRVDYHVGDLSCFDILNQLTKLHLQLGKGSVIAPLQTTHLDCSTTSTTGNPDDAVLNISKLSDLRSINFQCRSVTDNFLKRISNLKKIEYLNLRASDVTDDGFKYVKDMENLTCKNTNTDYCLNIKTFSWQGR